MKALSLTQPWATAVALELKRWETRSWPTGFRGEVCIHAAKGFPGWAKDFAWEMAAKYGIDELRPTHLPLGAILCVANLTECRQTETAVRELSADEQLWGDYGPKRFCFKFENVRKLSTPVPALGALGFWEVAGPTAEFISEKLAAQEF